MLADLFRRQRKQLQSHRESDTRRAVEELQGSLARGQGSPQVYLDLAQCLRRLKEHEAAADILRAGCERTPTAALYTEYVDSLTKQNRTVDAITAASLASALFPSCFLFKIKEALTLPIVYENEAQVDYYRQRFSDGLEALESGVKRDTPEQREDAFSAVSKHHNFLLAYQMRDDLELQRRYASLVHRITLARHPDLSEVQLPPVPAGGRIRIGYISASLRNLQTAMKHSVAKTFAEWVSGHDPSRFEVFVYNSSESDDVSTERPERCEHYRKLPLIVPEACAVVRADRLDAVVFLDVGMTPRLTPLACLRLAKVQCVTWGHPVTTGSPNMDYFLSSDLMEPEDGDSHYSERLIRLPGIGTDYSKPFVPRSLLDCSRAQFGLRENAVVYLCCQSTQKYLPDHDDLFVQIAKRVPASQFVFLTRNNTVAKALMKRLSRAFAAADLNAEGYCVLLATSNVFDYWALNLASDIFLDTPEWSGCNSTMEAIACRLPIVALPGRFMRGRHSYAILTQLGVTGTIAKDKQNYVDIAVRLATDEQWRTQVTRRMAEREARIFSDKSSTEALERFLVDAIHQRI